MTEPQHTRVTEIANARLIAAAPEMLEALENVLPLLCSANFVENEVLRSYNPMLEIAIKKVRRLIAEAKGDSVE
jgi:hypothetical protein